MQRPRIIPILSLSENRLVNTIKFKNPRYIGDPINTIRIFNEKLVDEIIILDISASRKNINPNYQLIENMASECFMPISYGGGIKSFEQAKKVFDLGVEKVVLNSCCYLNMKLVEQIASHYGSQSVVVSMDYRKDFWGNILFISHGLRKKHRLNFLEYISELEQYGMGELILTSIENDGCFSGFNKFLFPYVEKIMPLITF